MQLTQYLAFRLEKAIFPFIEFIDEPNWLDDPISKWWTFARFKALESVYHELTNPGESMPNTNNNNNNSKLIIKKVEYYEFNEVKYKTYADACFAANKQEVLQKLLIYFDLETSDKIINCSDEIAEILLQLQSKANVSIQIDA
jgi:hypothetical protein